jgi:hypothetical protein
MPVTRYADAVAIVGEDLANELEEIYQKSRKQKSDVDGLVYKSETEDDKLVDKIINALSEDISLEEKSELVEKAKGEYFIKFLDLNRSDRDFIWKVDKLLRALKDDGTVVDDAITDKLSQILNEIQSKSEIKEGDNVENKEEKSFLVNMQNPNQVLVTPAEEKDDDEDEKEEIKEEWMPLGGALSLEDAKKYKAEMKVTEGLYKSWDLFGTIAYNILVNGKMDNPTKISKLLVALDEFRGMLTPEVLVTLSQAEKTVVKENNDVTSLQEVVKSLAEKIEKLEQKTVIPEKIDPQPIEVKEEKVETQTEKSELAELASEFSQMVSEVEKSDVQERKEKLQQILNYTGNKFSEIHQKWETEKTAVVETKAVNTADVVKIVEQTMDEKFTMVNQQLAQLANLMQAQVNNNAIAKSQVVQNTGEPIKLRPIPIAKGTASVPTLPQTPQPTKPMSIREIALKSTLGR